MSKSKSSVLKNTIVLLAVTFVAVLALAVVNQITKGPIEQAEMNARAEVYKAVYSTAAGFDDVENKSALIESSAALLEKNNLSGCSIDDVLVAKDSSNNAIGYVIAATSPNGYGGDIQIAVGIENGVVTGFQVVSNSETAGLGSKCTDEEFAGQFKGKVAQVLSYTKTGATAENEIDAISGATITTNAVTEATNAAMVFYLNNFAVEKGE